MFDERVFDEKSCIGRSSLSNFLCFTSFFAHFGAVSNNFNGNDQNRILGKRDHE